MNELGFDVGKVFCATSHLNIDTLAKAGYLWLIVLSRKQTSLPAQAGTSMTDGAALVAGDAVVARQGCLLSASEPMHLVQAAYENDIWGGFALTTGFSGLTKEIPPS